MARTSADEARAFQSAGTGSGKPATLRDCVGRRSTATRTLRTSVATLALLVFTSACAHASANELVFVDRGFHVDVPGDLRHAADATHVDLRRAVGDALGRIQAKLQTKPTSIRFFTGSRVIPQLGITGFTNPGSGAVAITIDLNSPVGVRKILNDYLGPALAHELHHSKRILVGPGYGALIGQAVVTEGMAIAFERDVYPDDDPPYARALAPDKELSLWRQLQPHLNDADYTPAHSYWFFGTNGGAVWAGYTIGYHIAKEYLQGHPKESSASLALLPTPTLLSHSGYDGHVPT